MMYVSCNYSTASFLAEGSEEIDGDVVIGVSVIAVKRLHTCSDSSSDMNKYKIYYTTIILK